MNKELKISLVDLCIGYACAAFVMYTIGATAYHAGKHNGKLEITDKLKALVHEYATKAANENA